MVLSLPTATVKPLARDRNTPRKHVWRAEIVLLSADGVGTNEIMRRTGKSKTCVWRWQERFIEAGYDSLLHDKTPLAHPAAGIGHHGTRRDAGPGLGARRKGVSCQSSAKL